MAMTIQDALRALANQVQKAGDNDLSAVLFAGADEIKSLTENVAKLQNKITQINLGFDEFKKMHAVADSELIANALEYFADELVEIHGLVPSSKPVVYAKEKAELLRSNARGS